MASLFVYTNFLSVEFDSMFTLVSLHLQGISFLSLTNFSKDNQHITLILGAN